MKSLLKVSASISVTEIVLIFVALIKNKFLAVTIGAVGFGMFGLLTSLFNFFAIFAGGWVSIGLTKYLSEYNLVKYKKDQEKIISFSFTITIIIALLIVFFVFIFRGFIINYFLSNSVPQTFLFIFSLSFIGNSLRPVYINILQGLQKITDIIYSRIAISIFEIISIISLVLIFNTVGFFYSILVSSLFFVFILLYFMRKEDIRLSLSLNLKNKLVGKVIFFGFFNLGLGVINLGSVYLQNKLISFHINIASVGLFWAATSIKTYSDLIGRSSGFYFLPKMSKKLLIDDRSEEFNNYMFFSILTYTLVMLSIMLFIKDTITILFSEEFLPLISVLPFFLIAEFLHNLERPFTQTLVGMAFLKIHTISVVISCFIWIVFPYMFIEDMGLIAIPISLSLGHLITIMINGIYLKRRINLILVKRNILLISYSICAIFLIMFFNFILVKIFIIVFYLILVIYLLSKKEKDSIKSIYKKFKNKLTKF